MLDSFIVKLHLVHVLPVLRNNCFTWEDSQTVKLKLFNVALQEFPINHIHVCAFLKASFLNQKQTNDSRYILQDSVPQ